MMQWLCAILSAGVAAGSIRLLSSVDEELPLARIWVLALISLVTGTACWWIQQLREGGWCGYTLVFCAYLALTAYTDACIHKVYTFVNIAMLIGALAIYVVGCVQVGSFDALTLGFAAVLFLMGWIGVYGRGDGYVLATICLYLKTICADVLLMMLGTILAGCLIFVLYSAVDYLVKRKRFGKPEVKFWKQKRPLLPGIVAGFVACALLIP